MSDRAFFFHLQGLESEWIAKRLSIRRDQVQTLITQGMGRAGIREAAE